ncbi:TPA: hypothetical protein KE593_003574 [Escherichia coli]|uniref:hypothetical protein n=1 Tax=Escherichia ruysiae TaxID=2608867 RepID=UPI0003137569|nr:hypothetical protein WC5_01616 [Escherichia sp. KTE114]MBY7513495.1 hypothetical protein [Escherichia ruysiae]HBC8836585.1 hypothetical protein [Escherichia coli]HCW1435514.1 hypothetical protein [Escherichia coli]
MTDAEREYLISYLIGCLLGRRLEALDTAKRMLQSGVPLADIMLFTGLSEEELVEASQ